MIAHGADLAEKMLLRQSAMEPKSGLEVDRFVVADCRLRIAP